MRACRRHAWQGMAVLALAAPVHAEGPVADSAAVEYFTPEGVLARAGLALYGDARLRRDVVRDRPGGTEDLELTRVTLRGGLIRAPWGSTLRAEVGLRLTLSSAPATRDGPFIVPGEAVWAPVINEAFENVVVDRAGLRFSPLAGALALSVGRQRSPLRLTEMIWDDDLRPLGIAAIARRDIAPGATGRLGGAVFSLSGLDGISPRAWVSALQLSTLLREESATGADVIVGWLRFGGSPTPARQNQTSALAAPPRDLARFDVVDLQLGVRADLAGVPVGLRLDLARNVAHPTDRDGARARLAIGGSGVPAGIEVGWVYQRVEREAVPGAYNSDDWWFHTRMRGHQVWFRVAPVGWLEARAAGFTERRDDLSRRTRRLTFELSARLPAR